MRRYFQHILQSTERAAELFLRNQVTDPGRADFGGIEDVLINVKPTVYQVLHVLTVFLNQHSRYYKNNELLTPIKKALNFVEREIRPEGTLDYPSCNFSSAPDTAFCLKKLIPAYQLLGRYTEESEINEIKEQLSRIIKRTLIGIKDGGFHTPNHRWAITAALMQGYNLFKDEPMHLAFKQRAEQYLAEGIDGNEDGEYAERSTGNYNAVVNTALITLFEETGDEKYLYYVKRNLEMMLFYFEPDDTIFTQNSTRQDKGLREYGLKYFYQFLYLADHFKEDLFDGAAHKLIHDNEWHHDQSPLCLSNLMLNTRLLDHEFHGMGFLENYRKHFIDSGVVRVRKNDFSYSIIENQKHFLFLQKKDLQLYARIGLSYCDIRSFKAQKTKRTQTGYELSFKGKGWYYLPFDSAPETSDWWTMDHTKRELLIANNLEITVIIQELEDGLSLELTSKGCDKIPIRFELALPKDGTMDTTDCLFTGEAGRTMILKNNSLTATYSNVICHIEQGFATHRFTGHYSGEDKNEDHFTVIMTDYTPVNRKVLIRFNKD